MSLTKGNFRVNIDENNNLVNIKLTTPKEFIYKDKNQKLKEFKNDLGKIEININ